MRTASFQRFDVGGAGHSALTLDAQTLENLEILRNDQGGEEGTLLKHIDHTVTPFGHRMIVEWLCRPLFQPDQINYRLDAVDELMRKSEFASAFSATAKKLPVLAVCRAIHGAELDRILCTPAK